MSHEAESSTIPASPAAGLAEPLTPTALRPERLARFLNAARGQGYRSGYVQTAIDGGAPVGVGERGNLVEFMAWLERELAQT